MGTKFRMAFHIRLPIWMLMIVFGFVCSMAACGGGGGDPNDNDVVVTDVPTDDNNELPADDNPLNISANIQDGDYLEYVWNYEHDFNSKDGSSHEEDLGFFRITFGVPTTINGMQAFPLSISGDPGSFEPRWAYIAYDGGDLYGSVDGNNMEMIYSGEQDSWIGGGFFKDWGQQTLDAKQVTFYGSVNTLEDCVGVKQTVSSGGCENFSDIGLGTICSEDSEGASWAEYYKDGLGPVGYYSYSYITGGSTFDSWSGSTTNKVELVETNLSPTDGTQLATLAWRRLSNITNRSSGNFCCAAFKGKIYLMGGNFVGEEDIPFTEVYDPQTGIWEEGPSGQPTTANAGCAAAAWGEYLYFFSQTGDILCIQQDSQEWTSIYESDASWPSVRATAVTDGIYVVTGGEVDVSVHSLVPDAMMIYLDAWNMDGERYQFAVASLDSDLFILGGSRSYLGVWGMETSYYDTVYQLEVPAGTWSNLPSMPTDEPGNVIQFSGRERAAATVVDGNIVVIGGEGRKEPYASQKRRSVVEYDPQSGIWSELEPLMIASEDGCACELDGYIYYFCPQSDALWRLDPNAD